MGVLLAAWLVPRGVPAGTLQILARPQTGAGAAIHPEPACWALKPLAPATCARSRTRSHFLTPLPTLQVEAHWSEKPLAAMTERDWRIFREDFNIAYKGNARVLPLRSWDEAAFPEPIRMVRRGVGAGGGCCLAVVLPCSRACSAACVDPLLDLCLALLQKDGRVGVVVPC